MHSTDHAVEGSDGLGRILAGQGGVGGGFEGGEDFLVLPFDVLLDGFEILAGKFVGEAEEGLILLHSRLVSFSDVESIGYKCIPRASGFPRLVLWL